MTAHQVSAHHSNSNLGFKKQQRPPPCMIIPKPRNLEFPFPLPTAGAEPALSFQPSPAPLLKTQGVAQLFLLDAFVEQKASSSEQSRHSSAFRSAADSPHESCFTRRSPSKRFFHVLWKKRAAPRWRFGTLITSCSRRPLWRGPWKATSHTAPMPGQAGCQQD